jgi:hypothetical protein
MVAETRLALLGVDAQVDEALARYHAPKSA